VTEDHDEEMTREDLVDEAKEKAEDLLQGIKGVARGVLKTASEEIAEHRGDDKPAGARDGSEA
jgi:hypothetical protein